MPKIIFLTFITLVIVVIITIFITKKIIKAIKKYVAYKKQLLETQKQILAELKKMRGRL